jgi:hypothetical protein
MATTNHYGHDIFVSFQIRLWRASKDCEMNVEAFDL